MSTRPGEPASARVSVPTVIVGTADVLVVLSLRGGFDGLSAIVPAGDANYYRARPNIAVPASAVKKIDATFGLAPGLKALYPLWDAGKVAAAGRTPATMAASGISPAASPTSICSA